MTCSALAMRSWRLEVVEPLLDALYWNTNGRKDTWAGSPPIPPTPLTPNDSANTSRDGHDSDSDTPPTTTRSVNVLLPPLIRPGANGEASSSAGKGKAKSTIRNTVDVALSIPVQVPVSPAPTGKSGRSSPQDADGAANGKVVNGSEEATTKEVASRGKKRGPRAGGKAPPTSLAAVRAATAAAVAAREAQENGDPNATIIESGLPQKSRLSRAVTFLLDSAFVPGQGGQGQDALGVKASYAGTTADSLMMCGISPDNLIRKRLDRFLTKMEAEGQMGPRAVSR